MASRRCRQMRASRPAWHRLGVLLEWHPKRPRQDSTVRSIYVSECHDSSYGHRWRLFDRYILSYFSRSIIDCPTLGRFEPEAIHAIAIGQMKRAREFRSHMFYLVVGFVAFATLGSNLNPHSKYYATYLLVLLALLTVTEGILLILIIQDSGESRATIGLFLVIRELELNAELWSSPEFRNHICIHLDASARCLQAIPLRFHGLSPSVRKDLRRKARRKAQAVRDLEFWAMQPGPFTFTDLVDRLAGDLRTLAHGRWYELPEAPYERQLSVGTAVLYGGLAALLAAGSVVTISLFARTLGAPGSAVLADAQMTAAVWMLSNVGIPISRTSSFVSVGSQLLGGPH